MAEAVAATVQARTQNSYDSGSYISKQSTLAADADTTPWQKVFEEFSVFIKDGTTFTMSIQMAFKDDKSDAFIIDTQDASQRSANYQFTGYGWVRAVRTAATGTNPTVTLNCRED